MKKIIGIIPARAGSKRVKNKNIRVLAGKPLIQYTIEAALASRMIDRIIVSTDSKKIKAIAQRCGAEVPFMRPASLAKDSISDGPVIQHVLKWLYAKEKYNPEFVVYLRPTTPFKTAAIIDKTIRKLSRSHADVARTITKVEGVHHPYWMYSLCENERVKPFIATVSLNKYYQRQLLPDAYRINGVVDVLRTKKIKKNAILDVKNTIGVPIDEESTLDIDTELDFNIADSMMRLKQKKIRKR